MKAHYSVVFLVLCTARICTANPTVVPPRSNATAAGKTESITLEVLVEQDPELKQAPITIEELEDELSRELDYDNEIEPEPEIRPTKKPKRPQAQNKRPPPHHHHHQHPQPMSDPMPYYAAPAPMTYSMPYPMTYSTPYSQCPYSQPPFSPYPAPMYPPPYPFPGYSPSPYPFAQPTGLKSVADPTDTTEVVNVEELLKFAKFWNNKAAATNATTTVVTNTVATKPPKRFLIKNWIRNKINSKTTTTTTTTTTTPAPAA
ncbi:uncharacterized protein Dvir_GJ14265 [Drosophila virilis]|uniref:Uncharacterized protein n=1 Tax=Drosophila virilis TaxID=7244 RepID=B4MBP1_DROVI|nr:uncharacterized protein Dvir_GJ14265 [Drosophila virilis]